MYCSTFLKSEKFSIPKHICPQEFQTKKKKNCRPVKQYNNPDESYKSYQLLLIYLLLAYCSEFVLCQTQHRLLCYLNVALDYWHLTYVINSNPTPRGAVITGEPILAPRGQRYLSYLTLIYCQHFSDYKLYNPSLIEMDTGFNPLYMKRKETPK